MLHRRELKVSVYSSNDSLASVRSIVLAFRIDDEVLLTESSLCNTIGTCSRFGNGTSSHAGFFVSLDNVNILERIEKRCVVVIKSGKSSETVNVEQVERTIVGRLNHLNFCTIVEHSLISRISAAYFFEEAAVPTAFPSCSAFCERPLENVEVVVRSCAKDSCTGFNTCQVTDNVDEVNTTGTTIERKFAD